MDGIWPMDAARVPADLPPDRAWRWCLLRTLRDARLAAHRGRPISRPNLERLFYRRWWRASASVSAFAAVAAGGHEGLGRAVVRQSRVRLLSKEQRRDG